MKRCWSKDSATRCMRIYACRILDEEVKDLSAVSVQKIWKEQSWPMAGMIPLRPVPYNVLRMYCGKVYGVLEGHLDSQSTHPLRAVEQAMNKFAYPATAFEFNEFFEYGL
jgi:hypothetical protein